MERGHLHPLTQAMDKAGDIFQSMGFEIADGPNWKQNIIILTLLTFPKTIRALGDVRHIFGYAKTISNLKSPTRNA